MRVLATALFAGLLAVAVADASEIATGAVVHGDAVFLRTPDGLAAHAATTGARTWSSPEDVRPLAAHGVRLLGQVSAPAGQLRLVVLSTATGQRLAEATIALPEGVSAPLDDTGDTQFRTRVEQSGAQVRLEWRFEFRPMRGIYIEGDDGSRRAEGAVVVDLDAGRATAAPARPVAGPEPLPASLAVQADAGAFRERPLRIGTFYAATQEGPGGVVLKRWTAQAAALPDVAMPAGFRLQMGSATQRHVLLSRVLPGEPLDRSYEWSVIALDLGSPIATLRAPTAAAGFEVAGARVLVAQQALEHRTAAGWQRLSQRLEAFDLASGAPAWVREVRDPSYRGPVAP
jgi:hypothetical protein